MQVGDTYTITVKAGDAEEETFAISICAISFVRKTLGLTTTDDKTGSVALINTGDGAVTYTSGTTTIASVESGLVTAKENGSSLITATVADSRHCFYPTKTDTYQVGVGDVVIGKAFAPAELANDDDTDQGVKISGMNVSETGVTVVAANDWVTIKSQTTDASGVCTITYNVEVNEASSPARSTTITVTGANGTTVINVSQAAGS
jgi:hypothetical protein